MPGLGANPISCPLTSLSQIDLEYKDLSPDAFGHLETQGRGACYKVAYGALLRRNDCVPRIGLT